jgi:hypothetical protein
VPAVVLRTICGQTIGVERLNRNGRNNRTQIIFQRFLRPVLIDRAAILERRSFDFLFF